MSVRKNGKCGKKKILADLLLISALVVVSLSVFLFARLTSEDGDWAVVSVDGEVVARYSLSEDGEYALNGGTNLLIIRNKEAYVADADCPDKLCEKSGRISRVGERIVCLPNRVMIEIDGERNGDEIIG